MLGGDGADTLIGFENGTDVLDVRYIEHATFLNTSIVASGANTRVTFISGESVLLVGVTVGTIAADDFLFV